MQPKFTQQTLRSLCARIFAIALILMASTQVSFSQLPTKQKARTPAEVQAKLRAADRMINPGTQVVSTNDAGIQVFSSPVAPRTEAICTTYTGSITAADPAFTSGRLFRDGIASTCAVPKVCPGNTAPGSSFRYKVLTFTEPSGSAQCVTVTHTNTGATGAPHMSIHSGPFDPLNICTNYLADEGGSPNPTFSVVSSFTIAANATVTILLTETAVGAGGDFSITMDLPLCAPLPPCTAAPAPGNTLSTANPACLGVPFTLSIANNPAQSGLSWQWESSPDGTTWSPIVGATSATLVRTQSVLTHYRNAVTCAGFGTTNSNPIVIPMNPPTACYCIPPISDCTDDDVILRVRMGTLDNSSSCNAPSGYSDFTGTVAAPSIFQGAPNPMTVNVPTIWSEQIAVWIDYNRNGAWEADEFTNIGNSLPGTPTAGTVTNNIVVPATAQLGLTRMRVRTRYFTAWTGAQPCAAAGFGETEDYMVNLVPCVPGTITTPPATTSIACGGNASFTVAGTGSLLTWTWQQRVTPTAVWTDVANGGVFSGATTNTLTLTNVPSTMTGYQYRALMRGACTSVDFSIPATLTVTPLIATVNPTSATICSGSVQALTLTNASSPTTSTFASGTINIPIPDGSFPGPYPPVAHTINLAGIPAGAVVTNLNVRLNITHDWVSDMMIVLRAPNGNILNLCNLVTASNQSGANFVNTIISSSGTATLNSGIRPGYTGTFRADAVLAGAFGIPAGPIGFIPNVTTWSPLYSTMNGGWTIAMYDAGAPDAGLLNNWSLEVTYGAAATGVWTGPASTMFTDAAATIPYVTPALANSIYVKPTTTTTYSVVYSTATPCTSGPANITVNVSNPAAGLAVTPLIRDACVGSSASFTATTTGGGPFTWQWESSPNGTTWTPIAGATGATLTLTNVTAAMGGNRYRVIATAGPCGSVTSTVVGQLAVNPLPVVAITASDLTLIPGQSVAVTANVTVSTATPFTYAWTRNGVGIGGAATSNSRTATIDSFGTYQVTVTDNKGCVGVSNQLVIGTEASDRLWIYPNPSDGIFQVRLFYRIGNVINEKRVVSVYTANGDLVARKEFALDNVTNPYLKMEFDLSRSAPGTYVVKVADRFSGQIVSGLLVIAR